MLGTSMSKREDRLVEASQLMLKAGNVQEYCELQMKIGNYEDAIAYAPKVSLDYWNHCVAKYQEYLTFNDKASSMVEDLVDEQVSYQLLMSQHSEAAETLEKAGQFNAA